MKMMKSRHYFNDIPYTKWPFFISIWLFLFIFYFVLYINKYLFADWLTLLIPFIIMVYYIMEWFFDLDSEAVYLGRHNTKVKSSIVFGFFLFLTTEALLFAGFFWAFFDRFFHTSFATSDLSLPYGIEHVVWARWPLFATLILVTSGYCCNLSYYYIKVGNYDSSLFYSYVTLALALSFLGIQFFEYSSLRFSISDSVYCSLFYLLTGFHGMHVVIGTIFLAIQTDRLYYLNLTKESHLGYSLALIYWHFVDIIWIFLFIFVYFKNNPKFSYQFIKLSRKSWYWYS